MEKTSLKRTVKNWEFFAKEGDPVILPEPLRPLYPLVYEDSELVVEKLIYETIKKVPYVFFILKDKKKDLFILDIIPSDHLLPVDYMDLISSAETKDHTFFNLLESDMDKAADWYVEQLKAFKYKNLPTKKELIEFLVRLKKDLKKPD